VASETGNVYTFATPKLQPIITKPEGKALIQTCLNPPEENPQPIPNNISQQRLVQDSILYSDKPKDKLSIGIDLNSQYPGPNSTYGIPLSSSLYYPMPPPINSYPMSSRNYYNSFPQYSGITQSPSSQYSFLPFGTTTQVTNPSSYSTQETNDSKDNQQLF